MKDILEFNKKVKDKNQRIKKLKKKEKKWNKNY